MAGMYPDNQTLEVFGKTVTWPGVNSEGKFTNGDFNDPLVPPSYIPADTINLVVDNLNTLVTSMGGEPNNTKEEQLAALFSAAAVPLSGIKRDAHGRAQVAAPEAPDDIARKEDIDGANETSASHAAGRGSNAHGATVNAAAGQIITRDAHGRAQVTAPAAPDDIARKADIDAEIDAEANARISAVNGVNSRLNSLNISLLAPGDIIASPTARRRGFLLCDGSVMSRTEYAALFSAIGTKYGNPGSTTFTIPDFRACFLRGAGVATKEPKGNPAAIGTRQGDAIRNIMGRVLHFIHRSSRTESNFATGPFYGGNDKVKHSADADTAGSAIYPLEILFDASRVVPTAPENRPVNHAINWFIKY